MEFIPDIWIWDLCFSLKSPVTRCLDTAFYRFQYCNCVTIFIILFIPFIVAPCIIESTYCLLTNKCTFYQIWKSLNLYWNTHNDRSYMFRSSTILRELVKILAKVTLLLKHSVKLRRCILCGDVAACCHISTQYTMTKFYWMF